MGGPQLEAAGGMVPDREDRWRSYIREIARGDARALAKLYDESAAILFGLALRMLRNRADAEEVLLEVFEQIWRSAQSFNPARGGVWCWLTVVTRSRSVDRLRTAAARHERDHVPVTGVWDITCQDALPDQTSMLHQQQFLIRHALNLLPNEQRQALELAYFSELTHVEIAAALGVPLGTIKTRIRTAMDKLRVSLSQRAQTASGSAL